jgi:ATP-dependent phosphofructokinase / diphosphate-dependent phosphofructokinase
MKINQKIIQKTPPRIGFINSGGDCPGLNTVMDAIVRILSDEYEILGFYKGFEGLLSKEYLSLTKEFTDQNKFLGGTILKSVNKGNFAIKAGLMGEITSLDPKIIQQTKQNYDDLGLEALVVLGGDGSLSVALELMKTGINIVAVPKSIDNDLSGTDFTFGFQTAVNTATDSFDRLQTTATSHDRVMILELMGRHTGWITLFSGLSGGADIILIPEIKFSYEKILKFIKNRIKKGKNSTLIAISEGATSVNKNIITKEIGAKSSETTLGGIGEDLASFLNKSKDSKIEARSTSLGHIQRGGSPVAFDRILSRMLGTKAANLIRQKRYGEMASYKDGKISSTKILEAAAKTKLINPDHELIKVAKNLGVYFGD